MAGPVARLVRSRLRHRAPTAALTVGSVAAAVALVAILSGIGLVATDATLARTLGATAADRPIIRVSRFSSSAADWDAVSAKAANALTPLEAYAPPAIRGVLMSELGDTDAPIVELVIAVDDPAPWTTLIEGRLPAPCKDGVQCEAILLSEAPLDIALDTARPAPGVAYEIVGRGLIDKAVPFGDLDQRGATGDQIGGGQYQTGRLSPAVVLVTGVDALARSAPFERSGRTYVWTAALRPDSIRPWTLEGFTSTVVTTNRRLVADDNAFTLTSPLGIVSDALGRVDAVRGRLLLIGSLAVAILLAFAVFAALVAREDVIAEVARLRAVGARRRDRAWFVLLDALVPATLGGAIGWAAGAVAVAALASWAGATVGPVLAGALFDPGPVLAGCAVVLAAIGAIVLGTTPVVPHGGTVRLAAVIGITALVILGWQLATTGALEPAALDRSLANPVVVLLPPIVAFLVAVGSLSILPPLMRTLARRMRRAPLAVRLSLLSVSRDPLRPAATLTLLAFSLGTIVFAIGWSASLRQGIDDQAAYRSGLDLRVVELGTGLSIGRSVVPTTRYALLGDDITAVPVYREATEIPPVGRIDVIGLDPASIPTLPGWRSDFSALSAAEIAARLDVTPPAGGWHLVGHRLDAGDPELTVRFRYTGGALKLDAIVATEDGDAARVPLGIIRGGATEARAPLPVGTIGGTLIALVFSNERIIVGSGHQGDLVRASVAFEGLDGLTDATPIDLEVFTVSTVIIRAPQATDAVTLPAIASPDLAALADADGILPLRVGNSGSIPVRVVGTANRFPTLVAAEPSFVVVPLDPYLVALGVAVPGAGRPSEMWLTAPTPERLAEVRHRLTGEPFRFPAVTERAVLVTDRAGDPLSQAIVWALVVAAIAGLVLSVGGLVLGAVTDLRDERGNLADLEAQGVGPSTLRLHALLRTAWLAIGGAIVGLVVGVLLTVVATATLALSAEGTLPIPPLAIVIPIAPILLVVGGVVGTVLAFVAWLAHRTYAAATLGEGRSGAATAIPATTARWSGSSSDDG